MTDLSYTSIEDTSMNTLLYDAITVQLLMTVKSQDALAALHPSIPLINPNSLQDCYLWLTNQLRHITSLPRFPTHRIPYIATASASSLLLLLHSIPPTNHPSSLAVPDALSLSILRFVQSPELHLALSNSYPPSRS